MGEGRNVYVESCRHLITLIITLGVMDTKVSTVRQCPGFNVTVDLHTSPVKSRYSYPDNVTSSCHNSSLALIGQSVRRCLTQGVWDAPLPVCQTIPCALLLAPPGGTLILEYKNNTSLIAQFSCDHSRILIGQQMITCNKDGSWSDDPPSCLIHCGSPPSLENALIYNNCSLIHCQTMYSCEEGYELTGNDSSTCTYNGTWSAVSQYCHRITCSWPDLRGGNFTASIPPAGRQFQYNTTLRYTCGARTRQVGDGTLWCGPMGKWEGNVPECIKLTQPTSNTNTSTTTTTWSDMSSITSTAATAPPTTTTTPTPTSTPTTSTTTTTTSTTVSPAKRCLPPPGLKHGTVKRFGHVVQYRCDSGYDLHGRDGIRCLRNGSWSGKAPVCKLREVEGATTTKPFLWKQIFIDHKKWVGEYEFRDVSYHFRFKVQSVQLDYSGEILGIISEDHGSKFDVKGYKEAEDIVFKVERIQRASGPIRDTTWRVRGHLHRDVCTWTYEGYITSDTSGFTKLTMQSYIDEMLADPSCVHDHQTTLVVVGVCVAVVMVILVALVAYYCTKRKGGFRSSGHRSLTSFENPVYEYEHSLK